MSAVIFGQTVDGTVKLSTTSYADQVEKIAPGMVALVDQFQSRSEDWFRSLTRLLPFADLTGRQRASLIEVAAKAATDAQAAQPLSTPAAASASTPSIDWPKTAAIFSIGVGVWKLFF
jgi:hypothetical protein